MAYGEGNYKEYWFNVLGANQFSDIPKSFDTKARPHRNGTFGRALRH
jgi:hypothetical protein